MTATINSSDNDRCKQIRCAWRDTFTDEYISRGIKLQAASEASICNLGIDTITFTVVYHLPLTQGKIRIHRSDAVSSGSKRAVFVSVQIFGEIMRGCWSMSMFGLGQAVILGFPFLAHISRATQHVQTDAGFSGGWILSWI